jgi:hypothetical protein
VLKYISGLREASITLTLNTVRGLMIAHLQHRVPQIFKEPSPDGTLFRCSERFVLKFLHRALGWNMRRSTQAGRKTPANADEVLQKAFLRIAWVVKDEQIPSALLVNSDQTQVVLAQGCHMTYAPSGANQVATVGSEEKRAITILPSVTNDGKLLPIQAIYKGLNPKSLPSPAARSRYESEKAGFLFELSKTATYWSTIATMKNFVNMTLAPYFDSVREELGLDRDQMALWLIDCWSVHRSKEFLEWMASKHPLIIVIFVPAGMTGSFQPCDVGLQRIFKHSLKKSAHEDVVREALGQLEAGHPVQDVKLDTGIKILRDRTVHWIWTAYQALNKPAIIKKVSFNFSYHFIAYDLCQAWEMCRAGEFNLSYTSLTSREASKALRELVTVDPAFWAEITQSRSRGSILPMLTSQQEALEDLEECAVDVHGDDSEVPMTDVISAHTQVIEHADPMDHDNDDKLYIVGEEGGLVSIADAESTTMESVNGETTDATRASQAVEGRGKRKKCANVLYSSKFWVANDGSDEDFEKF